MFNINDFLKCLEVGPEGLTDELRPQFEDYLRYHYKSHQGALIRNRERIAGLEVYSKEALNSINWAKQIAYKFGVDITK